jgi:GntR family transcriptional regulator
MSRIQLSTKPIYMQLRDALAERIAGGEWKPGSAIPNEGDLAREFGVSAGTMRKALSLLENEHLITRRQGRGTYVNDPAAEGLADRFCNTRGPTGKLIAGRFEAAKVVRAIATDAEARRLRIGKEDPVWRIERVRFDGDNPFMHERVSLPADLFPNLSDSTSRIAFLAHRYGLLLGKAEERITIGAASQEVAAALRIPDDSPVMALDRVVCTIDGRPVEWRVGQCRTATSYVAHIH